MTAVSRGEITITNVNDGKTPYFHTAYSWSKDGTDRFTTIYPQDNKLENTQNPSVTKPVQLKGSRTSNTETITMNNGITRQEKKVDKTGEFYYRFMNTADNNLSAVDLTPGKTYHFGLDLRAELAEGDYITWRAQYKTATSSWINMDNWGASFSKIEGVTNEFQRFERELTIPEDATTLYFSYQVYSPNSTSPSVGTVVEFKNAKFALDSASPYTPSPEEDLANAYPTYLGTYSSFEEEDSLSPYDYTWSLIKGSDGKDGENGIPGIPGEDGRTPYFHTAYINSTDFGTYDYSGNPNLMNNIINEDWIANGAMKVSPIDNYLKLVKDVSGRYGNAEIYGVPTLLSDSQYTTSLEFYLESGTSIEDLKKCNIAIEGTYNGKSVYYGVIYLNEIVETDKWVNITKTFTTNTYTSNINNLKFRVYVNPDVTVSMRIKNNIKIEKGSKATPYQPNLLDAPWYFSTVSLGKNIADPTTIFPISTSGYLLYNKRNIEKYEAGQTYTLTMKATKPATQSFTVFIRSGTQLVGTMTPVEGKVDEWKLTFTVSQGAIDAGTTDLLQVYQYPSATKGECQIDWLKIEKGDTRTPNIDAYEYLGNYTDFEQADSLNPTKYSWSLIRGETPHFHTAYINSTDFGAYDYSGNPNLINNASFDLLSRSYSTITPVAEGVTDHGDYFEIDCDIEGPAARTSVFIPFQPRILPNIQYTLSVTLEFDEAFVASGASQSFTYGSNVNGTLTRPVTIIGKKEVGKNRVSATFTTPSDYTGDKQVSPFFQFWFSSTSKGKARVYYDIKLEKGSTATPYQPNLLDSPYYFSKVTLGENIADPTVKFPITSSETKIYTCAMTEPFIVGETYTITLKGTKPADKKFRVYNEGVSGYAHLSPVEGLTNVWSATFTVNELGPNHTRLNILQVPTDNPGKCTIEWLKIEKGDTRTPNIGSYKYLGSYVNFDQAVSPNPTKYSWNLIKGSDGKPAKTLILSASSNTVKINQDSSIQSDTITLQANMQNMVGTATFSATPYIGTTPQTAITLGGTGNTRTFSTSSWNKNWTSLVVTATFESFIDKQTIISVKEGKDGTDSITGLLTNESVTLAADKDGVVESFSEASGTFKVFDGLSDVTGRNVAYRLKSSLGGTFNINASTGVYNMTEMSKDSAIAVFEATYKNIKIEKILNVAKSKAGKETYTYTKYSNSKDFGNYDYSGNPNIAPPINDGNVFSLNNTMTKVTPHGTYAAAEKIGNDLTVGVGMVPWHRYDFSKLTVGKQYTLTIPIRINESYNGDISKLFIRLRCLDKDNTALLVITSIVPRDTPKGVFTNISATFNVQASTQVSHSWYAQVGSSGDYSSRGSIDIGYEVKLEEGAISTSFQPNLKYSPWYISNVPVGENIRRLDAGNQPPLTTTEYNCYIGRINGYWKAGETYTITVEGTKPATQTFGLYLLNGSQHAGNLSPVEGLPDTWSLTFTPTKEMINVGVTNHANIFQVPQSTKGEVKINSVKIEKGKYRTPEIDPYKYMGVYVGGESEQPHNPTQYAWSQIKGNDSTSYSLLLSSQVMSLPRGASKLVPENVTISGMAQTGEKSIENIKSRIVVEETTNGTTWTTKYDADALTYTYTPSSLNVLSARVKMYVAGAKNVQLDQKSINIVKDGSNGSNGSNGSSSYTWIRYSENANGNPMTTTPNSKTKYIGIAITQTSTAPSAYSSYTWSRIKGSGGLVAKVYSNGGTNIEQSPIQINVETQSDGDIVEPNKVTWYMSKDSSVEWTAITAGNGITLNKKYIVVEPVVFLESNSISFKAQVEYNSMTAFDYMTVNNKSFDATKPLILRQPAAPLNPYPGLLWLDTSSGSGDPLDKTNPSLVYRWGKSAIESVNGTEYAHYAYANTPTGYQEDGVTPDPSFSVTYNSSQKPMYIGHCVTDTASDPTTPSSYNWKSITTENGSEDVNGAKGIAQEKIETTYEWGWVVLSASDLEMLPWLNNEDGSTIIDWIYQITQKTSDDSIVQTVVGSEDMSKVYAKTDAVDELSSANHELSDKIEEYNKQMQDAFAGIDTTYVNKSEFEQEMNKFNFGIDKAGGVNLIRNSTGFQWEDTAPSDEMLTNPKFEGTISTTGLDNGWVYNDTGMGQIIGAENDLPEYKIMRIGGTNSRTKYSYSKNIPVTPGQLINISGQARIPNTIGDTQHIYVSIRFYGAASNPSANSEADTIGNGQGFIYLFTDKKHNAGSIFGTDSYTVKTNNIVQDIWSNYSVNVTIPSGAAFMKICLYNSSTTVTDYFDFRKPSVVLYSGMFDFWHKNDSANAQIRQILGDESLEELGLIAGFELKGLRYKLDQDILLPNPNTEYTLSWYANKISRSGKSKYYVKVLNTKTGAEIAVSEASADTIGYQRMSVTFSVTNTSAVTIRIGLEGEGSANATLSAAGLMINIGPYPLSWQSHHEEVYSTNVRIDSSGLKVFNSDYDGYNVMTPREFAGYYRNGEVYERVFTLNKDTTKVKKLEAQERFMMKPVQIVSVDSPTIQGWAFVGYNGEDTD